MGDLAAEGDWVVISGDEAIRRNPAERRAWIEMRLTTFFLQSGWMRTPMEEQAWRFLLVSVWPAPYCVEARAT
jgi:hypothetical protein